MDDNYYDDSNEPTENPEAESEGDSNVAILPKSFFPSGKSPQPGSTCTLKVEEVREDQVLVKYQGSAQSRPPMMGPPDEEMMGMME